MDGARSIKRSYSERLVGREENAPSRKFGCRYNIHSPAEISRGICRCSGRSSKSRPGHVQVVNEAQLPPAPRKHKHRQRTLGNFTSDIDVFNSNTVVQGAASGQNGQSDLQGSSSHPTAATSDLDTTCTSDHSVVGARLGGMEPMGLKSSYIGHRLASADSPVRRNSGASGKGQGVSKRSPSPSKKTKTSLAKDKVRTLFISHIINH